METGVIAMCTSKQAPSVTACISPRRCSDSERLASARFTMTRCTIISTFRPSRDKWCTISRSVIRFPICASRDEVAMVGILAHGDNHFIVRGPLPDREVALALVRHWSLIQIGATTPPALNSWDIVSREFRENLRWALVVPGDREISRAVMKLLRELSERGITIHDSRFENW